MTDIIFGIVGGAIFPLFWAILFGRRKREVVAYWLWNAPGAAILNTALIPIWHTGWYAVGNGVSTIIVFVIRWWRRKKRRTAAEMLGAKTRALRDALVRKARETAIPRPVLVPGAARAAA